MRIYTPDIQRLTIGTFCARVHVLRENEKTSIWALDTVGEREECVISKILIVVCFAVVLLGITLFIAWKLGILTFYSYKIK